MNSSSASLPSLPSESQQLLPSGGSKGIKSLDVLFRDFGINLRCLFTSSCGIDDELEWIGVLILLHQLQVSEPLGAFQRIAGGKSCFRGFDQSCCHLVLPVR